MKKFYILLLLVWVGSLMAQDKSSTPSGRFSGYMFGDYFYNFSRDPNFAGLPATGASGAAPGGTAYQAFQLRRVYFAYDYDISQRFTTRFRLEMDPTATLFPNNKIGTMVKDAYLQWNNVFSGSNLIFGISPSPSFDASEGAWGYRSLEKTIMDLRGIDPSRDFGVALKGKLTGDGMLNYWVMFANGSGNSPETDKYKRYYGQISLKPSSDFYAMVNFDFQDRAQVADPYHTGSKVDDGTTTLSGFVTYGQSGSFKLGVEAFTQSTSNGYNNGTALTSKSALGLSFWGSVFLQSDLAVVLRYDNYDPNTDGNAKGDVRNLIIGGLDWKVEKNVSIIPNLYYESYQAPTSGSAPKSAVTGRITMYWIFQ